MINAVINDGYIINTRQLASIVDEQIINLGAI